MTDKQIIIDGLSCDNCAEFKRCQEQQTKKEYAINQVLQDIPSKYANIINRLKQIIPSITRCDYVLEKQLKRKEQECEVLQMSDNEAKEIIAELKAECDELKKQVKELHQGWIDCDKERNLQEANSEFRQRVINRYKQTLIEIIRFFKEDKKFARYSGYPIVFTSIVLEEIEKILKENDIEISEVLNDGQETN